MSASPCAGNRNTPIANSRPPRSGRVVRIIWPSPYARISKAARPSHERTGALTLQRPAGVGKLDRRLGAKGALAMTAIRIRTATTEDRDFMFGQANRLLSVATLPWHAAPDLVTFGNRYIADALARPDSESAAFIAEDESSGRVGFVHVEASTDFIS